MPPVPWLTRSTAASSPSRVAPSVSVLQRARSVADRGVLLAAIEHEPHRRLRAARQLRRDHAEVPAAELRAEAAAHEVAHDADLGLRQVEHRRELVAHRRRALRRHVDGELVGLPVGDDAVGLHRRVRLHLRAERAAHLVRAGRERGVDVAVAHLRRSAQVALLREILGRAAATRAAAHVDARGIDQRRVRRASRRRGWSPPAAPRTRPRPDAPLPRRSRGVVAATAATHCPA